MQDGGCSACRLARLGVGDMMQFDTDTERDAFQEVITRHQMGHSENDIRYALSCVFLEIVGNRRDGQRDEDGG